MREPWANRGTFAQMDVPRTPLRGGVLIRCLKHLSGLISTPKRSSFTLSPPPDVWAPHPISQAKPCRLPEKPHFSRLHLQRWPFGHYPEVMTIGECRNVERPANGEHHLPARLFLHHSGPVRYSCISTDTGPNWLSTSRSILPTLVNKTPKYLNSQKTLKKKKKLTTKKPKTKQNLTDQQGSSDKEFYSDLYSFVSTVSEMLLSVLQSLDFATVKWKWSALFRRNCLCCWARKSSEGFFDMLMLWPRWT